MRKVLMLVAVLGVTYCGQPKPEVLRKWQETAMDVYHDTKNSFHDGVEWTVEAIGNAGEWTATRIRACFAGKGKCNLRLPKNGKDGKDGKDGEKGDQGQIGTAGQDGANGANGSDGVSCQVTDVSNGVLIDCGESSAVVFNGEDGGPGESCELERRSKRCYGSRLRYDLYIVCGNDSERLGRYSESRSSECR